MTPIVSNRRLQELRDDIVSRIGGSFRDRQVAYCDIPVHFNIGDSLIYKGTEVFFERMNSRVILRLSDGNNRLLRRIDQDKDVLIVLHGGGNLGDLYPAHETLRREVVEHFPEHQIIIMPQSAHYRDPSEFERTARLFAAHRRLTLCVRDQFSCDLFYPFLQENVILCPDMAQMLDLRHRYHGGRGTLALCRRDIEADARTAVKVRDTDPDPVDWDDLVTAPYKVAFRVTKAVIAAEDALGCRLGSAFLWSLTTDRLVAKAVDTIGNHDLLRTDRLHGVIAAQLLGVPVEHGDNAYRKIARYSSLFFSPDELNESPQP